MPPRGLRPLSAIVAVALAVTACGGNDSDDDAVTTTTSTQPDAESTTTSTSAGPDAETDSDPEVRVQPVAAIAGASSVADPTGPGPVLVSTLSGEILTLDLETGATDVVLDLGGIVSTGGEQGLLDIVIDPDGERLVANLTNPQGDTEIRSWPIEDGRPVGTADDGVLHLEIAQPYANHNGGNLEFGPDGHLWIGTGDGGGAGDPDDRAQDPDDLLGKMLRVLLDPAGGITIPDDNPTEGVPEVWAVGLRNPWRYSFDSETGKLWIADVGQESVEEISVVDPAEVTGGRSPANFGWNRLEGNDQYSGTAPPDAIGPVFFYRHDDTGGCSITGGHVYRGSDVPSLVGWLVFGDFCGGWLWALSTDDGGERAVSQLHPGLGQIVSIEQLADGELLVLTGEQIFAIEG